MGSVFETSPFLFWIGVLAIFSVSSFGLLRHSARISQKLALMIAFLMVFRSTYLIRDFVYDGYALLPSDSHYSLQLVKLTINSSRIFGGMGTHRATSYSHFPLATILSSAFLLITGIPELPFATALYPTLTSSLALCLLLIFYRQVFGLLREERISSLAVFSTFVFSLNIRFLSLYRQFRQENLAFVYLLLCLFFIFSRMKPASRKDRYRYLVPTLICALGIPLCHIATGDVTIWLLSLFVLLAASIRKIGGSTDHRAYELLDQAQGPLVALLILILSVSFLWVREAHSYLLEDLSSRFFSSLLGHEETGFAKFTYFSYTREEILVILVGNVALGILLLLSFIDFFKARKTAMARFVQCCIIASAALGLYLIVLSPFRTYVFERGYFYMLLFSSIGTAGYIVRTKPRARILASVLLFLFLASQLLVRHQCLDIYGRPLILKSRVRDLSYSFADFGSFPKGHIAAMKPAGYLEIFTAINMLNPICYSPEEVMDELLHNTDAVVQASDYVMIYADQRIINRYIDPNDLPILKSTVSSLYGRLDLVYDEGSIQVFGGEKWNQESS